MGAALLVMVTNLTTGRKRFAGVESSVQEIRKRAEALRDRAQLLIEEDIEAYGRVAAAMSLPRSDESERVARRAAIQDALQRAAVPPLATMRAASEVLDLARLLVGIGNPSAVSDVGSAAAAARAGYDSARLNVEINLASMDDQEWCDSLQREMAALPRSDDRERDVLAATEAVIRGGA
jgi:formiminotetrahydrofolate cyclodeaminase